MTASAAPASASPTVGLYLDVRNPPHAARPWPELYEWTIETAVAAERQGIGAIWFSEHHGFDDGYLPQPLTLAAAVAARTTSVRLGTAVLLPAFRHPQHLAEEAAVVDILSNGRLELGVGVGYRPAEFDMFGLSRNTRYEALERVIREVARLWSEGLQPQPVQTPVPCWGGFFGPRGARLAGRLGMGLLSLQPSLLDPYLLGLEEAGLPASAARFGGHLNVVVARDPEAAWARVAPHAAYQADSYNRHAVMGTESAVPPPVDPVRLRRSRRNGVPRFDVVTPDAAVALVRSLSESLPVKHVFFWARVGAMPDDLVEEHVQLVATEVAPQLRREERS